MSDVQCDDPRIKADVLLIGAFCVFELLAILHMYLSYKYVTFSGIGVGYCGVYWMGKCLC